MTKKSHNVTEEISQVMAEALFRLRDLVNEDNQNQAVLLSTLNIFLTGVISTAADLAEVQYPGSATLVYADIEAVAKEGGLSAIVDFAHKYSERQYSVSNIADDDMETAMNYVGTALGNTLIKSINELPMPLRKPETFLRGIEAMLANLLNQKFDNSHEILDSLCDHVHMALNSLGSRKH